MKGVPKYISGKFCIILAVVCAASFGVQAMDAPALTIAMGAYRTSAQAEQVHLTQAAAHARTLARPAYAETAEQGMRVARTIGAYQAQQRAALEQWRNQDLAHSLLISKNLSFDVAKLDRVLAGINQLATGSTTTDSLRAIRDIASVDLATLPNFDAIAHKQLSVKLLSTITYDRGILRHAKPSGGVLADIRTLSNQVKQQISNWKRAGENNYLYCFKDYVSQSGLQKFDGKLQHNMNLVNVAVLAEQGDYERAFNTVYAYHQKLQQVSVNDNTELSHCYEAMALAFRKAYTHAHYEDWGLGWGIKREFVNDPICSSLAFAFSNIKLLDAQFNRSGMVIDEFSARKQALNNTLQTFNVPYYRKGQLGPLDKKTVLLTMGPEPGLHKVLQERFDAKEEILGSFGIHKPTAEDSLTAYRLIGKEPQEIEQYLHNHVRTTDPVTYEHFTAQSRRATEEHITNKFVGDLFKECTHSLSDALAIGTPECQERLSNRLDALEQACATDYARAEHSIPLSDKAQQLVTDHDVDVQQFMQCEGSELQLHVQQEIGQILEQTADYVQTHTQSAEAKPIAETIVHSAEVATQLNQQGCVREACIFTDFCWATLDCAMAAAEGVGEGVVDTVQHVKNHPIETVAGVVARPVVVTYHCARAALKVAELVKAGFTEPDGFTGQINRVAVQAEEFKQEIIASWAQATTRDVVRSIARFGTNLYLQGKVSRIAGNIVQKVTVKAPAFAGIPAGISQSRRLDLNAPQQFARGKGMGSSVSRDMKVVNEKYVKRAQKYAGIKPTSISGQIKKNLLPCEGKIRYIPPRDYRPGEELPKEWLNGRRGFRDRFGNIWAKGDTRTGGDPREWDVQLSSQGKAMLVRYTKGKNYVNVSMEGRVTH